MTVSAPSVVDARPHVTAVKAALNAALTPRQALDYDEVPGMNGQSGTTPKLYVALSVERRGGTPTRASATTGRTGWRIAARCVADTVDNTRMLMSKVATALNEVRLTIEDVETSPVTFEADQAPEYDSGKYSALALYTYAH